MDFFPPAGIVAVECDDAHELNASKKYVTAVEGIDTSRAMRIERRFMAFIEPR